ncbi:MAG: DNA starvation/stationary phase protection protein [Prolixibacteraceae bacterium]|nr:DNA starvation/stationary phase protection protein [Prolixibacteraceae bacterium]
MKTSVENTTVANAVSEQLNQLLADYQIYYQNLRTLHWYAKGRTFFALHAKFEEYYNEASEVVDELAERVLMLGGKPIHSFAQYIQASRLAETEAISDGTAAVNVVLANSEQLLNAVKETFKLAGDAGDEGTVALLSGLIGSTEKRIWMLKSFLQ